jgi:hypothetical protein
MADVEELRAHLVGRYALVGGPYAVQMASAVTSRTSLAGSIAYRKLMSRVAAGAFVALYARPYPLLKFEANLPATEAAPPANLSGIKSALHSNSLQFTPRSTLSSNPVFKQALTQLPRASSVSLFVNFGPINALDTHDHSSKDAGAEKAVTHLDYLIAGGTKGSFQLVLGLK